MSTLLSAQSISYETNIHALLVDVNFNIQTGDRIGLIGHNGSGKSTLLKLLTGELTPSSGNIKISNQCIVAYIEQHLPQDVANMTLINAVLQRLTLENRELDQWRAEVLLQQLGFLPQQWQLTPEQLSGGQHTRLLLARALIQQPDLLLLDEPSNHLDLPTLLWLSQFLQDWKGTFILVSHDQSLLDKVTNCTWILRDKTTYLFRLPCSAARKALAERDISEEHRHLAEQKEIDRIAISAKRLAIWGQVYDNENLSRKAKQMEKQIDRLKEEQTSVSEGYQWQLTLSGRAIQANRVLEREQAKVMIPDTQLSLFTTPFLQVKSGDRIAIIGANGCGKSTLMRLLWQHYQSDTGDSPEIKFHPRVNVGYYDQRLHQLNDNDNLLDALSHFAPTSSEERKMALIGAGFPYLRHQQTVATLSGGERSRLLFIGLSLAQYALIMLDEPTNHLDIEGKEALGEQINCFEGAAIVVSHDRWLIENSCNRFWFIHNQQLEEYHNVDLIYQQIEQQHNQAASEQLNEDLWHSETSNTELVIDSASKANHEDALLSQLLVLEDKLAADRQRKASHQKVALQQIWENEIQSLKIALGL